jgi:hypothetical protein
MNRYNIANWNDRHFTKNRYMFFFGAYGATRVLVFASDLDAALDEAVDWLVDNAPGHIVTDMVNDAYKEAVEQGLSEEKAIEWAEQDTLCAGNCGDYVLSYECRFSEIGVKELKTVGR